MKYTAIIADIKDLTGRSDLPDLLATTFLNIVKLDFQRSSVAIPLAKHTLPIVAKSNKRSSELPSDFLAYQDSAIRRKTPTVTTAQSGTTTTTKFQSLAKYDLQMDFENDYPSEDSSGNLQTGFPEAFLDYGQSVIWGPIPSEDETLQLDYYRKLPEYSPTNDTDIFSELAFDMLLFGGIELVYRTWTKDIPEANVWKSLKDERAMSLKTMQIFQQVSGSTIQISMPRQTSRSRNLGNRRNRYDG